MRTIILALLTLCSQFCRADEAPQSLAQAKAAFERYAPTGHFHVDASAFGDINSDGVTDFVTFIGDPQYTDNGVENLKAVVFLGARDNSFTFYEASSEIIGHERVSHELKIENQTIFLRREGMGWAETFRFKIREGHLALIGLDRVKFGPDASKDTDISANLLTGQVIRRIGNGRNRWEKKSSMPTLRPLPFQDFDYGAFEDNWSILW